MILRASSLNPNDSATLRVASECQNVSKPDAGEARSDRSMNKTTALRNMFQSPAHRLEQHQPGWPIAQRNIALSSDRFQRSATALHARLLPQRIGSNGFPSGACSSEPVCYTISFKHIPSKKACSFPKNMSGIWPVK